MSARFFELMFSEKARAFQESYGSRRAYARIEAKSGGGPDSLSRAEMDFIAARDSFYMATVGENGWPYVQHRGGPKGFVSTVDGGTLVFPDFSGNKQYISLGNLKGDDRASFFFVDYPHRARLKVLGRIETVDLMKEPELLDAVCGGDCDAPVERVMRVHVEAFDWNCPQYITPRFTIDDIERAMAPVHRHVEALEAALREAGLPVPRPDAA